MKKILYLLLMSIIFGLYGCGSEDSNVSTPFEKQIVIFFDCTTNLADVKCSVTKEYIPDNMQILQYYWDFGDNKGAQGKDNGNHTYDVSGKYNISLKIQYEENGSPLIKEIGTKQINISIPDTDNGTTRPNEIEILFDCTTNLADVKCSITKEVVPDNMQILQYYWDFGDSKDAQGKDNGNHTYTSIGKYNIRLGILYELQDGATETKIMGIKSIEITQIPPPSEVKIRNLFLKGFGDKTNGMYFALHITGKSERDKYTNLGIFAQNATSATNYKTPYARDLEIQWTEDAGATGFNFSALYSNLGLDDVYDINYGWTDKDGLNLDMPFYLGHSKFYITDGSFSKNFSFKSFVIEDMTIPGFMGYASFVRCNVGNFNFKIPLDTYNPAIHKNIALLTVEFRDTRCSDYEVTFDGFVEK